MCRVSVAVIEISVSFPVSRSLDTSAQYEQTQDNVGQTVMLDRDERMIHVFQIALSGSPELKTAFANVDAVFSQHLGP